MSENTFRSGFVSIIGKPNAGKSTLLNELMGEKMSIVTEKVQTTRHRIFGIVNEENLQIIFSDTPGIIEPQYELQEKMMEQVSEVFQDSDAFIYIADINDPNPISKSMETKLNSVQKPVLVLLNKMDNSNMEDLNAKIEEWHTRLPKAEILPISALHKYNTELLIPKLKSWLPEHPPYYEQDAITDKPERFFVNETIREKILRSYQKEIPYAVEVVTESFKESDEVIEIESVIYTERESQKGILLGHKGIRLAKVRRQSEQDLEKFLGKPVRLNLFIKVLKNWRKNDHQLKRFGY